MSVLTYSPLRGDDREATRARLSGLVTSSENVMGGAWVFRGTRVPVDTLFDNLADGLPLAQILQEFPTLDRADCVAVLRAVGRDLGAASE